MDFVFCFFCFFISLIDDDRLSVWSDSSRKLNGVSPSRFSDGACAPLCAHECREETKRQSKGAIQQRTIDAPVEGLSLSLFSSSPVLFYLKIKKNLFTNKRGTERTNERGQQTN
jgi:hypothetical protein